MVLRLGRVRILKNCEVTLGWSYFCLCEIATQVAAAQIDPSDIEKPICQYATDKQVEDWA
eukprot:1507154-Amphidinium_carterae.1